MRAFPLRLLAALAAAALCAVAQRPSPFPEGAATITHVLMHYSHPSEAGWLPVYGGLMRALPAEVRVTIAVQRGEERDRLDALLRGLDLRRPDVLEVGVPISPWARDRALAIGDPSPASLLTPRPDGIVDGYAGDLVVAADLAERLARVSASVSLAFEGGDIVSSAGRAFVGHGTILDNAARGGEAGARRLFASMLQQPVVVVGRERGTPHDHLDMYLTALGDDVVMLGSPAAGLQLLRACSSPLPTFDEWPEELQEAQVEAYEAIRRDLERRSIRVLSVPILHGINGCVLTYNNGLVERRGGEVRVYMPSYGVPLFDDEARQAFELAGCRVLPIDVADIAADGGTVRCLTNVVSWRADVGFTARG